jgi:hypothetical protein
LYWHYTIRADGLDSESIRRALIADLEQVQPELAATLAQLTAPQLDALLRHVRRRMASR